jgi:hypothetical protein
MNKKMHYKQLQHFDKAAQDMTQNFKTAAWYADRGNEFSMQPNFAPTTQNGGASPQQVSQWNYRQCQLAIDAALALWHSLTNMFI